MQKSFREESLLNLENKGRFPGSSRLEGRTGMQGNSCKVDHGILRMR